MLQHDHDCIFCVVDLHAITMWQDPELLAPNTREVTAGLIASVWIQIKILFLTKAKSRNMQN